MLNSPPGLYYIQEVMNILLNILYIHTIPSGVLHISGKWESLVDILLEGRIEKKYEIALVLSLRLNFLSTTTRQSGYENSIR